MALRRRTLTRFLLVLAFVFLLRLLCFPSHNTSNINTTPHRPPDHSWPHQIKQRSLIERATRPDQSLDVQRHRFLQVRMGRDERGEIMANTIAEGMWDWWERFQIP